MNLGYPLFRIVRYLQRLERADAARRRQTACRAFGAGAFIADEVLIWGVERFSIGDRSAVNGYTFIYASGGVELGADVMVGANCVISSVTHPTAPAGRRNAPLVHAPVIIEDNVWLGMGALVLPGVRIGRDAIVGAGAVVTRDVAPATVVGGNPARVLRHLSQPGP